MEMLQRDLTSILSPASPSDVNLRALGHSYGLAALVCVIPDRPLYVSYDISAKVLDMAIQLLKRAGEHDVKVAGIEVEVAWTLIASLMSLGPNFVRPHLPQLLVLWRNALPKPTSKDNSVGRPLAEWMFLLHVRESALGAILCFLEHNASTLVTLDVGRRIASLLSNALLFANNFLGQNVEDVGESQVSPNVHSKGLSLKAREALLRRRVYQCFAIVGFSSITESTQSTLLQSVVSLFASPDGYAGSSVQAAIASSSGTFTSVWQSADGYAYGVTYTEVLDDSLAGDASFSGKDQLNRDSIDVSIDSLVSIFFIPRIVRVLIYNLAPKTSTRWMRTRPSGSVSGQGKCQWGISASRASSTGYFSRGLCDRSVRSTATSARPWLNNTDCDAVVGIREIPETREECGTQGCGVCQRDDCGSPCAQECYNTAFSSRS